MLEFLTRWTPLAQFLGPLVAGVAAVFAARSAGAARRAAELSGLSRRRDDEVLARQSRPVIEVRKGALYDDKSGRLRVFLDNLSEENEAKDVEVFAAFTSTTPLYQTSTSSLAPEDYLRVKINMRSATWEPTEGEGVRAIAHVVVEFWDAYRLWLWRKYADLYVEKTTSTSGVVSYFTYVDNRGDAVEVHEDWPARSPSSRPAARRFAVAWQVIRGRR